MSKSLPIGIQSFEKLRNNNLRYIDKTQLIYNLILEGSSCFLSRPRRFGKSLLISTLEALFLGKKDLFKGLWIENSPYNWNFFPVIRIDFSQIPSGSVEELKDQLTKFIMEIGKSQQIILAYDHPATVIRNLITELKNKTGQKVVILIDEYDSPIISHFENLDIAKENRETLQEFYRTIKGLDEFIRFLFVTGISKFSQVSVFSGANQLTDISMSESYSTLLGYTQEELESNFSDHIQALALHQNVQVSEIMASIKHWYNGYRFSDSLARVYNPFSTLKLFQNNKFADYWFESGTPTFLTHLVKEKGLDLSPESLETLPAVFSSYDPENLNLLAVLFQTGYLTIQNYDPETNLYQLDFPNYEVRSAWMERLLSDMSSINPGLSGSYVIRLTRALQNLDFEKVFDILKLFFANIPYDIQLNNEKYYQSIFFSIFSLIGTKIHAEVRTNKGRIDAVVEMESHVFIFEFKLNGSAKEALDQIKRSDYAQKYQGSSKIIHLFGVAFDHQDRNIGEWIII